MAHRQTKLARQIFETIEGWSEVTRVQWGEYFHHHKGAPVIKANNGNPGLVVVEVCEPAVKQKIHIHTRNCPATIKAVGLLAKQHDVAFA